MRWRVLGVAVVLLGVGLAGGYAVAQRGEQDPVGSSTVQPVPGVSPAVPTPDAPTYAPDPPDPPLTTAGLVTAPVPLRLSADGPGVRVNVPVGWQSNRPADTNQWNFVDPANDTGTYLLRVTIVRTQNVSIKVARDARISALQDTEANGAIADFTVTAETPDTFEATYVDGGHLRYTTERWVSFDGANAYASVAVTGREVDQPGLGQLLGQTITSLRQLPPKPDKADATPSSGS